VLVALYPVDEVRLGLELVGLHARAEADGTDHRGLAGAVRGSRVGELQPVDRWVGARSLSQRKPAGGLFVTWMRRLPPRATISTAAIAPAAARVFETPTFIS